MDPCLACHCPPPANRGGASATALTVATIPRRVRRTIVEELPGWARSSEMVVSVTLEEMDAPSCVRVFRLVLTRFGGHLDVSTKAGQDHCRHRCRRPRGCHRLLHRTPCGAGGARHQSRSWVDRCRRARRRQSRNHPGRPGRLELTKPTRRRLSAGLPPRWLPRRSSRPIISEWYARPLYA